MKLSIVIGVSQYTNLTPLPCCKNDVGVMSMLVGPKSRFDDHLIISKSLPSSEVQDAIAEFIGKHKPTNCESIDEIFFYFSGHGRYDPDAEEYYYCLADYNQKKPNSTSLINSQLDDQFRALKPRVLVKVVDACQSGTRYVKADDAFLQRNGAGFENCYFLFSSEMSQSSYGDKQFSDFTRALAEAVAEHAQPAIRYSDLVNHLRDYFDDPNRAGPNQRPQFVTQGAHLEVFCDISQTLRQRLKASLAMAASTSPSTIDQLPTASSQPSAISLVERVRADAESHCTEEQAMGLLGQLKDFFQQQKPTDQAADLFDTSLSCDVYDLPDEKAIGRWAEANEKTYFVEPIRETAQVNRVYDYLRRLYPSSVSEIPLLFKVQPRFVEKISGAESTLTLHSTLTLPFENLRLIAVPKFPNLPQTAFFVVPFLSRTHLTCFAAIGGYKRRSWNSWEVNTSATWISKEVPIRKPEELFEWLDQNINRFWVHSLEVVTSQFRDPR